MGGFRERAKKMKEDLLRRHEESIKKTEEGPGGDWGSIFFKDKIPTGMGFWLPQVGEHLIDIVPFFVGKFYPAQPEGSLHYMVQLWVHLRVGPTNEPFVCQVRNEIKRRDPMCEYTSKHRNLPKEEWNKISSKNRTVYLVWVHDNPEEEDKGLQIWEVAHWNCEKTLSEISKNPKGGDPLLFSDIDTGKSIAFSIKKSGTFIDSDGQERDSKDFVGFRFIDRDAPLPDYILEQSFPLDEIINWHPTYEEMKRAFEGTTSDEEETPNVPVPPAPSRLSHLQSKSSEETPKTKTTSPSRLRPRVVGTDFECPYGHTAGVDIDKQEDCRKCEQWDPCSDLADQIASNNLTNESQVEPEKKEGPKQPPAETRPRLTPRRTIPRRSN